MKPILPVLLWLAFLTGCPSSSPFAMSSQYEQGLVVVLPGLNGRLALTDAVCRGIVEGGVPYAVEVYDWTSMWGPLASLTDRRHGQEEADKLVEHLAEYQDKYPGRPVFIVGHSAGAGPAIWAAESMPSGHRLDGVLLLAPALSPGYELDLALGNCRRGIVNFYSEMDWAYLGVGTSLAGTVDREHTVAAGKTGFTEPRTHIHQRGYDRLFQVGWRRDMAKTGNLGMHVTSGAQEYVRTYVAPFLREPLWSQALVDRVLATGAAPPGK